MIRTLSRGMYTAMDRARVIVIVILFGFVVAIGAVQIYMRYTPGLTPMSWITEIMRYLNIWIVMLAASVGVKRGAHLRMDYLLYKLVPARGTAIIQFVARGMMVLSLCLLIYHGLLRTIANLRAVIQTLPISISWFYAAIPVGGALILLEYILVFTRRTAPSDATDA